MNHPSARQQHTARSGTGTGTSTGTGNGTSTSDRTGGPFHLPRACKPAP